MAMRSACGSAAASLLVCRAARELSAGIFVVGLETALQGGRVIEFLRTESVYGSGTAGSQSVSGVVGDFAAKLTPSLAAAVQTGQLMRIVGPASVVDGLASSRVFLTALEAVLEVQPLSARHIGFNPVKAAAPAASDFEALENLGRLALVVQVPAPKQLELVLAELAAP